MELLRSHSVGASIYFRSHLLDRPLNIFLRWCRFVNIKRQYGHRDVLPQGRYMAVQRDPLRRDPLNVKTKRVVGRSQLLTYTTPLPCANLPW